MSEEISKDNFSFLDESNKKSKFESFAIWLIIAGVGVLFVGMDLFFNEPQINKEIISLYGQFIGGIAGSIWTLAGVALFYAALRRQTTEFEVQRNQLEMQREELILQRDELKLQRYETELQRKEFERQTEQLKLQNATLAIQKFESTFFQLLAIHNDIVQANESRDLGKQWAKTLYVRFMGKYQRSIGRNSDRTNIESEDDDINSKIQNEVSLSLKDKTELINDSYYHFVKRPEYLDRYFNNLYFLLSFVHKSTIDEKSFYMNIIRSQLTVFERLFLFYFSLTNLSEKELKFIIEKYALLTGLPMHELIDNDHKNLYQSSAFENE